MSKKKVLFLMLTIASTTLFTNSLLILPIFAHVSSEVPVFQKGMSYLQHNYAFDSPESEESLCRMAETNTEYVAINVFYYVDNVSSTEIKRPEWWPTNESVKNAIEKVINYTHNFGMKVMLKPMVDPIDVYNHSRVEINGTEEWFGNYTIFINFFAELAEENEVELFCVGCELSGTQENA